MAWWGRVRRALRQQPRTDADERALHLKVDDRCWFCNTEHEVDEPCAEEVPDA